MKRQRTKCFTGCWTCRSRRVKCDEKTPSCLRCRQMGVVCEGYGLRLNWMRPNSSDAGHSDDCNEPRGSRRSLASLVALPPLERLPSPELDAALTIIDEWSPAESAGLEKGAFCVFSAHSHVPVPRSTPSLLQTTPRIETIASTDSPDTQHTFALTESIRHDDDTREAVDGGFHGFSASVIHQATPGRESQRTPPRHLDALSMPAKQKRFIHHWITFTSRKLVLIDEPHNPCRTMMLPMALKGLVSASRESNADVAIFHAICAAAAYNLFELTGQTNEQDRVLALYHDNEAVHHLRHNLARADEHRDQSFAMAIMACIAVEAVSGTTQRWRTHVSGGIAYLKNLQSQGLDEAALSAFRQHMVKMAILCDFAVSDDLKGFLHDETGASDGLEFTFPYYGVSRTFLRAHDHINTLLTHTALEHDLDAFELQLYLDFPGLPPQTHLAAARNQAHGVVIHHTSKAFYYANLVYFQRSVRHAPLSTVQELVDLGVQELESIDRVGEAALGCLMLWPVLILGAECQTPAVQKRMREWFRAQRRLGFRNVVVLEDLVATLWEAREGEEGGDGDWRRVIAQARFDVFRL